MREIQFRKKIECFKQTITGWITSKNHRTIDIFVAALKKISNVLKLSNLKSHKDNYRILPQDPTPVNNK